MWGCELTDTSPDIVLISKTIGGGIPTSMMSYRPEYDEKLPPAFHIGTYRGNPLALAAGTAVLNILQKYELPQRVMRLGSQIMTRLQESLKDVQKVGEVRGSGFMIGVEMVEDRKTKACHSICS